MARHTAVDASGEDDATSAVRPYAVTGGRTAPSAAELPLEALVEAVGPAPAGLTREARTILDLTSAGFLSVAELSAHVRLPVPVVRVVIGDLVREGSVRVHGPRPLLSARGPATASVTGDARWAPTSPLSLLETVLHGISTL